MRSTGRQVKAHGAETVRRLVAAGWPAGTLINVNFPGCPADRVKGVKVVPQGKYDLQSTEIEERTDARQRAYYWIGLRRRKSTPPARERCRRDLWRLYFGDAAAPQPHRTRGCWELCARR